MRVLWFSNTPSLASTKVSKGTEGCSWIEALEKELTTFSNIELGVAFKKPIRMPQEIQVKGSNSRYFMVPEYPIGKIEQWADRFFLRPLSKKTLPHYLKVVEDFKPDVILFFGTEFDYSLIIPEISVPSIIWFQGNLTVYKEMYENGIRIRETIFHERAKNLIKCYTVYHEYRLFLKKVKREKEIFSFAKNFIGRTAWDRRLVNLMAPQAKYFHCEETLRETFWKYKWTSHGKREKNIITTIIRGQLYKGLETIYRTAILLEDNSELCFEWQVIGIIDQSTYVKAARKLAKFEENRTTVKLLGPKIDDDLVRQLLNADLYVHPSHIENSSNAIQEAMLLGMPVVATNVGGTPSLLSDGVEGILVQSKDQYALAGAILDLLECPKKAIELGRNARILSLKRNDNNKICSELIKIFEKVIDEDNEYIY